jgi:hypothetical protein
MDHCACAQMTRSASIRPQIKGEHATIHSDTVQEMTLFAVDKDFGDRTGVLRVLGDGLTSVQFPHTDSALPATTHEIPKTVVIISGRRRRVGRTQGCYSTSVRIEAPELSTQCGQIVTTDEAVFPPRQQIGIVYATHSHYGPRFGQLEDVLASVIYNVPAADLAYTTKRSQFAKPTTFVQLCTC